MQSWFAVDKPGLAKLVERKGKQFMLFELLQNAWDENSTEVTVRFEKITTGKALLEVEDDNPEGFANLRHAFTLFAESAKKADAEKRGRFNLGEKLVLALCDQAEISSTTGTVVFDEDGRYERPRRKRERGSKFFGVLKLKNAEFEEFIAAADQLLPPAGIKTTFNGRLLEPATPLAVIDDTSLPTEISDSEGVLRSRTRQTTVEIVMPRNGTAMLYEMGIPVVETDLRWSVNIGQKVPLNMDRDNVTPSYLGKVRALVTERMADELTAEDANSAWVRDAVTRHGEDMADATITRLADLRFGEKRVAYDPSDQEANALAVTRGYTVVHGGSLNRAEWEAAKRVNAILPAGQVTPSPKPFHPDGAPLKLCKEPTAAMNNFIGYVTRLGDALLGCHVRTTLASDIGWPFAAAYGKGSLTVNAGRLGKAWFEGPIDKINELLIHEFGHHYAANHLSEEYHDALCDLGGRLSKLALDQPELFKR